tara:strand:+ start:3272 stop:5626 length:2355 start_codon:yes stop_codon:yes gene_type:complete
MKLPISILIGNVPEPTSTETWGDIISNWESYAVEWNNSSGLGVDVGQAPVLDTFGDESISIKSMVKDLSDPKKLFTSKSRSFTVPASKKNNRIFSHYYNIDITNGLDSRELIPAKILMNNTTHEIGNISVEGVRMHNGVPSHYKIRFIGKLSELARKMGQDKLTNLNWTSYNNNNFDAKDSVNSNALGDIVFPLASRNNRYILNSNVSNTLIENATNIAYVNSTVTDGYGITEQNIIGAMKVGVILERIEAQYGFNFTGVFTESYITDLYLWLHKPDRARDGESVGVTATNLAWSTGYSNASTNNEILVTSNDIQSLAGSAVRGEEWRIRIKGTWTGDVILKLLVNGVQQRVSEVSGDWTDAFKIGSSFPSSSYTIDAESAASSTVNIIFEVQKVYLGQGGTVTSSDAPNFGEAQILIGTAGRFLITDNIPNMKVMEFLSSLFKMFNIVAEVDSDLNIKCSHYDQFMSTGTLKDVSEYINVKNYNINRPNLYGSIKMEFADVKVALELGYEKVNGRQYGEIAYELIGDTGVRLSGSEYKLKIENQRVPIEPLNDLHNQNSTNVVYTQFSDLKAAEQAVKPMFSYMIKTTGGFDLSFNDAISVTSFNNYIQPSNMYTTDGLAPGYSNSRLGLYFGEELNEYSPTSSFNGLGLFNNFYRGTVAMMFDEDKRSVMFDSYLPLGVIMDIKLSDTLFINNHYYNINSIETNYLTGVSKLDLTLVGRSKLLWFNDESKAITNTHATDDLYITYLNAGGSISSFTIAAGGTFTLSYVGKIVGSSHNDYTEV